MMLKKTEWVKKEGKKTRAEIQQLFRRAGIQGISKKDLVNGTGMIEHIESNEKKAKSLYDMPMGFGKYKNKSCQWVKDNDPDYWEWTLENVDWFGNKIDKMMAST